MVTETYEQRVAAGAALIDRVAGFDRWDKYIRLGDLDMASWSNCIGGQLCGAYHRFAEQVDLAHQSEVEIAAFNAVEHPSEYAALTAAWEDLIEQRRAVRDSQSAGRGAAD